MCERFLLIRSYAITVFTLLVSFSDRDLTAAERDGEWLLPVPELEANAEIPTLDTVLGRQWADDVASHAEIEQYVRALADAAPERTRLVRYGTSYEGRAMYYLVISSAENMARLDEIQTANLRLADPLVSSSEDATVIMDSLPGMVWLGYCIHGNETSGSDAALLTAYHLLADQREETASLLKRLVVFIDPLQNPDGRERFVNVFRETRGRFPQSEPFTTEHTERWPGGRSNHYYFDLNRDWYLASQVETAVKTAAYLEWYPHLYVDVHEMGRNSTYFFPPPRDPVNEYVLPTQRRWFMTMGRNQAKWFDRYGFRYTTREIFDEFFPGYGSSWPLYHGSVAALWEQAGVRGHVVRRDDERLLYFHDAVRHHYISGLAVVEAASANRDELVRDFREARERAVALGREGNVRHMFLLEGRRPERAGRLARLLQKNGIDVLRVRQEIKLTGADTKNDEEGEYLVPAGSYHIPVAQAGSRLLRVLMDRHADMGEEFVKRQLEREADRKSHEIYDITSWSLPLAWDVPCVRTGDELEVDSVPMSGRSATGEAPTRAKVAYLMAGNDDTTIPALAALLRAGLRVHVADEPLTLNEIDYPRGTLILLVGENEESIHDEVRRIADATGAAITATDTAFVDQGAHLGGPDVTWVRPPRVAIVVGRPVSYSAGHTWYLFDQVVGYPVDRISAEYLGAVDLERYDVLILPDGEYGGHSAFGESFVTRLKAWLVKGGTLVTVGRGAAWASEDDVDLLSTDVVERPLVPARRRPPIMPVHGTAAGRGDEDADDEKETEPPSAVPGAFLRSYVETEHWISFGYEPTLDVFMSGNVILSPLPAHKGTNVVRFAGDDEILTSGFCWPVTLRLLRGTPYAVHQPRKDGHVVAFTADPNARAMFPAIQRLMLNAVFFGPGH